MSASQTLLAIGFSLIVLGLVMRGLARSHRRMLAMRKQHDLDARAPGAALPRPTHLDRHLAHYANGVLLAGVAAVVAGIVR